MPISRTACSVRVLGVIFIGFGVRLATERI
jgi:threonine/homoserine/homoserine lactone efflux protein